MLSNQYQFPWGVLRSMIAGASAIDLEGLAFGDRRHADGFLAAYGYDPRVESTRRELEILKAKSLAFLREELLCDEKGLEFPRKLAEAEVGDLLVLVSRPNGSEDTQWACALLRVMHATAHARNDPFERYTEHIRAQILERIERHLYRPQEGGAGEERLMLGRGQDAVPLESFHIKGTKSMSRMVMKLLHKPGNLGESIHDMMGVRFVARDLMDVMLAVRFLRVHNVVVFANVAPDRSRNTLLGMDDFQLAVDQLANRKTEALEQEIRDIVNGTRITTAGGTNRRSSRNYRAIHFTVRQLVNIPAGEGQEPLRMFFPYEVQIMDRHAYQALEEGDAAHDAYVRRQRRAVKRRVLRGLVKHRRKAKGSL
jgi:uncharacterized protein (TIGR04562 family)